MKKFYMTMVAMLCGVAAMAQESLGTLSCGDVSLVAGGETGYLEVMLTTEDVTAIQGIQFYFSLPEGVSIAQYYDEDEEEYVNDVTYPIAKKDHQKGFKPSGDGYMVFLGGDRSMNYKAATNPVVKFGIVAAATAKDGTYDIVFHDAALSDKGEGENKKSYKLEDFTAKVTITGGTGINSINADGVNAPVYNLAGQRVNKAQKGVYIQNGKKVAVK